MRLFQSFEAIKSEALDGLGWKKVAFALFATWCTEVSRVYEQLNYL